MAAALLALALAAPPRRAAADWYAPDHAKAQFAGLLGLVSAGVGYELGRRGELDVLAGWVPAAYVGSGDLYTLTGRGTWQPLRVSLGRRWSFRPLTFSLALTYTRGENLWVEAPGRYAEGYYELPTALRATAGLGGTLSHRPRGKAVEEVGLYWELVASDVALFYWVKDRGAVDPRDVWSVALGVRVAR